MAKKQAAPAPAPATSGPPLVVLSLTQEKADRVIQLCAFAMSTAGQTGNFEVGEVAAEHAKQIREASQRAAQLAQQQQAAQQAAAE